MRSPAWRPRWLASPSSSRRSTRAPGHELVGPGSVHASLIEGGQELSSYPARCRLALERRTAPGESAEDFQRECEALVEGIEGAEVRMGLVRPPFAVDPDAEVVQAVSARGRGAHREAGRDLWRDLLDGCGADPGRRHPDGRVRPGRLGRPRGGRVGRSGQRRRLQLTRWWRRRTNSAPEAWRLCGSAQGPPTTRRRRQ